MKCLLTAAAAALAFASTANANGFDYLAGVANNQYWSVCGYDFSGCLDGAGYDISEADQYADYSNVQASAAWNFLEAGRNGLYGCGSYKLTAYDDINWAWYMLSLPDWDGYSGVDWNAYGDAYNIVSDTNSYLDYYLGDCSTDG